jgi:hypothetical protein
MMADGKRSEPPDGRQTEADSPSTLLPMRIMGLVLIVIGILFAVAFV